MQSDALWCTVMHHCIVVLLYCECTKYTVTLQHCSAVQALLHTPIIYNALWCTAMHCDARWCKVMQSYAKLCKVMHYNASLQRSVIVAQYRPRVYPKLHCTIYIVTLQHCIVVYKNHPLTISATFPQHQGALGCTNDEFHKMHVILHCSKVNCA